MGRGEAQPPIPPAPCADYTETAEAGGATAVVPHGAGVYDLAADGRHVNFLPPHSRYSL
eukprot:SAG11_NODE_26738_length_341_cov_1.000000_2_plen_58_part_01